MKERQIQIGDLVERFQGGANAGKMEGDTFIVSKFSGSNNDVYDENGNGHSYVNIRLVTPKDSIINSYRVKIRKGTEFYGKDSQKNPADVVGEFPVVGWPPGVSDHRRVLEGKMEVGNLFHFAIDTELPLLLPAELITNTYPLW